MYTRPMLAWKIWRFQVPYLTLICQTLLVPNKIPKSGKKLRLGTRNESLLTRYITIRNIPRARWSFYGTSRRERLYYIITREIFHTLKSPSTNSLTTPAKNRCSTNVSFLVTSFPCFDLPNFSSTRLCIPFKSKMY